MINLAATLTLNSAGFMSGIGSIGTAATGIISTLGDLGNMVTGLQSAFALTAQAAHAMVEALNPAGKVQQATATFETLLGSAGAARDRMAELRDIANTTNYGTEDLIKASTMLQNLTGGALAAGKGLRMVGDAAATIPDMARLDEVALHVGRLYSALQNGTAPGESLARLADELGLIDAKTKQAIISAVESGKKGPAVWALAEAALMRFSGQMDKQSGNWLGRLSTLEDAVNDLYVRFGAPVIDQLGPLLVDLTNYLGTLAPLAEQVGNAVAGVLRMMRQAFGDGTLSQVIMLALEAGFIGGVNVFVRLMIAAGAALHAVFAQVPDMIMASLRVISDPKLWNAVAVMAGGAANMMGGTLMLLGNASFWSGVGQVILGSLKTTVAQLMQLFLMIPAAFTAALQSGMNSILNSMPEFVKNQMGWKDDNRSYGELFSAHQATFNKMSGADAMAASGMTDIAAGGARIRNSASDSEMFRKGVAQIANGGQEAGKAMQPAVDAAAKAMVNAGQVFVSQFREAGDLIPNTAAEKLSQLMGGVGAAAGAGVGRLMEEAKKAPAAAMVDTKLKAAKLEAPDQLAKIGGFIGGQGPSVDHNRRTAENTTVLVAQQKKMIEQNDQLIDATHEKSEATTWGA